MDENNNVIDTQGAEVEQPAIENVEVSDEAIDNIAKDLEADVVNEVKETSNEKEIEPAKPNPIDINNFTPEQLYELQEKLSNLPQRHLKEEKYNTVKIRTINGKYIIGWSDKTHSELRRDTVIRADVLREVIPVLFLGDTEYTNILWKDEFIMSEQVECKILKRDVKEDPVVVGTTFLTDKEGHTTTQKVNKYVVYQRTYYDVSLPDGSKIKISDKFVN